MTPTTASDTDPRAYTLPATVTSNIPRTARAGERGIFAAARGLLLETATLLHGHPTRLLVRDDRGTHADRQVTITAYATITLHGPKQPAATVLLTLTWTLGGHRTDRHGWTLTLDHRTGQHVTHRHIASADGDEDPIQSALCLRLFGAVNRIAMASAAGWIDAYYPNRGGVTDVGAVVPAFFDFLTGHVETVREQMRAGVQTNDVTRAAPLSAAMNHVALATGLPLRLLEVGSSAGLNLLLDRYFVEGTTRPRGPEDSPLRLTGQFESGDPEAAVLRVAERRGCDLNPIDVHSAGSADLLRSFVWPEHVGRAQARHRVARRALVATGHR